MMAPMQIAAMEWSEIICSDHTDTERLFQGHESISVKIRACCVQTGAPTSLSQSYHRNVMTQQASDLRIVRRIPNQLTTGERGMPIEENGIVGSSPAMASTRHAIVRLARTKFTVLISGE